MYDYIGTTWMQELVWLVVNDCDFETAKKTQLSIRSPFLEMNYLLPRAISDKFEREAILRYFYFWNSFYHHTITQFVFSYYYYYCYYLNLQQNQYASDLQNIRDALLLEFNGFRTTSDSQRHQLGYGRSNSGYWWTRKYVVSKGH